MIGDLTCLVDYPNPDRHDAAIMIHMIDHHKW